jgi:hypothetical protein
VEHLQKREISSIYGISLNAKWSWNGALSEPLNATHLAVRKWNFE